MEVVAFWKGSEAQTCGIYLRIHDPSQCLELDDDDDDDE